MLRDLLLAATLLPPALLSPALSAQETDAKKQSPTPSETPAKTPAESAADAIHRQWGIRFSILGSKIRRNIISTDTPYGFAVRTVTKDTPAAKAGIEPGTIILRIDDKPFREVDDLASLLKTRKPGQAIKLDCTKRKKPRRLFDRHPWTDFEVELKTPNRRRTV